MGAYIHEMLINFFMGACYPDFTVYIMWPVREFVVWKYYISCLKPAQAS